MVWLWVLLAFVLTPVLGGTFWALATEGRRNHPKWGVFRSVQYAHRGLHNRELGVPENSMAAFRRARELGYGVELDVHLTKDGQLAVIHDKSLKRTAGVDAEVSDLTMEELKRCRLEGTQETIPALEEAARLFQGGPPLLVELKADYFDVRELVKKAVAVLDRCQVDYCIESFHPGVIFWLKRHRPDICRGQLSQNFWRHRGELKGWQAFAMTNLLSNFLTRPDFISFHWAHRMLPAVWLCRRLHRLPVFCWTVQSRQTMEQVEREGCLVIFEGFLPAGGPVPAVPKAS